jgi:peptidoglycan hydrolase-like protein with peptidoglycan-binding domain
MRVPLSISALLLATAPCLAAAPTHHSPATPAANIRHAAVKTHKATSLAVRHETVQGMATERATQIQTALIKAGYLSGEPSGSWDAESVAAMQKLQGDNGWQTKLTPDSRALIKLGLGPQQDTPPASAQASNQ